MAEHSPAGAEALRLHLLVLRCQAGDERAFTQLFEWFGKRTLGYLRGLVLSGLIATLSTVGIFLIFRTASLAEIQLRLAALEEILAARPDSQT